MINKELLDDFLEQKIRRLEQIDKAKHNYLESYLTELFSNEQNLQLKDEDRDTLIRNFLEDIYYWFNLLHMDTQKLAIKYLKEFPQLNAYSKQILMIIIIFANKGPEFAEQVLSYYQLTPKEITDWENLITTSKTTNEYLEYNLKYENAHSLSQLQLYELALDETHIDVLMDQDHNFSGSTKDYKLVIGKVIDHQFIVCYLIDKDVKEKIIGHLKEDNYAFEVTTSELVNIQGLTLKPQSTNDELTVISYVSTYKLISGMHAVDILTAYKEIADYAKYLDTDEPITAIETIMKLKYQLH